MPTFEKTAHIVTNANDMVSEDNSSMRVLHVDDDSSILEVSKQILMLEGNFEIDYALSVDEALQKLYAGHYDVIVSDYDMPKKNGLMFLEELRKSNKKIPFILFTGKGREEVAIKALNLGAAGYFTKNGNTETVYCELAHGIVSAVNSAKTKSALKESEFNFHTIANFAHDWIYWMNPDGKFVYVSPSCEKITGFKPQEFMEDSTLFSRIVSQQDSNKVKSHFELFNQDKEDSAEFRIVSKSGDIRWISHVCTPVYDINGKWLGRRAANIDITERKRVEDKMAESEEKFRKAFANSPDAYYIATVDDGFIIEVNDAFVEMFGYTREECIGKTSLQLKLYANGPPDRARMLTELKTNGHFRNLEFEGRRKNGEVFSTLFSGSILQLDGQKLQIGVLRDTTESKKAELSLRQSEKGYRELADSLPDIVFEADLSGKLTFVNNRAFEITGYTKEEFEKGVNIFQLIPTEDREKVIENMKKALAGESNAPSEYRIMRKDGTIFDALVRSSPRIAENKVTGLRAIVIDITERKKAEQERDRLLQNVGEHANALNCLYGLASLVETPGISLCEIIQRTPELISAAYQYPDITCARIILENEEYQTRNFRESPWKQTADIKLNDQKIGAIDVFYLQEKPTFDQGPFLEEERHLIDAIAERLARITERKKTEDRLKEAEEKHRTLLNASNVLVQSVDASGKYVFVNEEWKRALGYSDKDLEAITIMDVVRKDHLQYCMNVFNQVMNGTSVRDVETIFVAKDGRELVVSGNACAILKDGKFASTVAFFVDITERKQNEEKLRESSRRIEQMNEKLRVVGGLTRHDVRNKLSTVTGYAYILKKKHGDLADVVDGLSSMEQAVSDSMKIFEFARAYEQLGVEELVVVNVEKVVEEAIGMFSGLTFKVANECRGLTVIADSFLRQLIYNLIDNTSKYGKTTKTARIRYQYKDERNLLLIFEDDGVGIPSENKKQIFQKGFSTEGGTGFGLFLIQKMMDVYRWSIEENGESGKGARFVITIPKTNKNGEANYYIESNTSQLSIEMLSEIDTNLQAK